MNQSDVTLELVKKALEVKDLKVVLNAIVPTGCDRVVPGDSEEGDLYWSPLYNRWMEFNYTPSPCPIYDGTLVIRRSDK